MVDTPDGMSSQPSVATRVKQWWIEFPCLSRVLFVACVIVFTLQSFGILAWQHFCFTPYQIVQNYQVYRIFTSAFFHANLLHIIFNMLALLSFGPLLERGSGTAGLFTLTIVVQLVAGLLNLGLSSLFWFGHIPHVTALFPYQSDCGIGISGVLFSYLTIEVQAYDSLPSRSLFGLCTVPTAIYPWILLLIIQILWPGVSFGGHFCGILAGYVAWYLLKGRLDNLDRFAPSFMKQMACYKMGSGGYTLSGAQSSGHTLGTGQAPSSGNFISRMWTPSASTTQTPSGHPQVFNTYGTNESDSLLRPPPHPKRPPKPPPKFPGQGRVLGSNVV